MLKTHEMMFSLTRKVHSFHQYKLILFLSQQTWKKKRNEFKTWTITMSASAQWWWYKCSDVRQMLVGQCEDWPKRFVSQCRIDGPNRWSECHHSRSVYNCDYTPPRQCRFACACQTVMAVVHLLHSPKHHLLWSGFRYSPGTWKKKKKKLALKCFKRVKRLGSI